MHVIERIFAVAKNTRTFFSHDYLPSGNTSKNTSAINKLDLTPPIKHQPMAYYPFGGGSYGGSGYGGSGYDSGGAGWPGGLSGDGRRRTINHTRMLLNAREAYHDSPQMRGIVGRMADTIADVALIRESMPRFAVLGISRDFAKGWARNVDTRFDLYMRDKKQHRSEEMTGYQAQHQAQIFRHRDGEEFMRLYYSADKGLQNPLQWSFIDPEQIRGRAFTSTSGPWLSNQFDGITRDDRGREKAYDIYVEDGTGSFKNVTIQRKGPKSGRLFMLHGFKPEYAGQRRGYSRLGFALQSLQNITDLSDMTIKHAVMNASILATTENDQIDPSSIFGDAAAAQFGVGAASQGFGTNPAPAAGAGNVTDDALLQNPSCTHIPEFTLDAPQAMVLSGKRGDKLKPFGNTTQTEPFDKFVDALMYYLCAAAGIPLEVMLMKFSQNYSASRATLILYWRTVMMWREEWAADIGNPMFEMWIAGEIAKGTIQAPGWSDPILRAAWLNGMWRGAPMPDIDPAKTAKSVREYMSLALTTGERSARDLNGSDFDTNQAQLKHEFGEEAPPPWTKPEGAIGPNTPEAVAMATLVADMVIDELESRE